MHDALDTAIKERGGYPAMARKIGVSRQSLYRWVATRVPAEHVISIEQITGIGRHQLRPDLWALCEA